MGYQNLNKNIGTDLEGNALSADQVFCDGEDNIYLIEQSCTYSGFSDINLLYKFLSSNFNFFNA